MISGECVRFSPFYLHRAVLDCNRAITTLLSDHVRDNEAGSHVCIVMSVRELELSWL